jgi:SAM-dependent methyltransferase
MVSKRTDDADQEIDLEEIREFYDEVYYSEAGASGASRIPRHYFRLFKRLKISRGANVLDVACGTGEWLDACAGENCSVSGVDPVSSLKKMARVARADAKLVIRVPNKDFLTRKLGLFGGTFQVDAKEVVRTLEAWDALFVAGGLSVAERWKNLHVLTFGWIKKGKVYMWPFRALQGLLLVVWPLRWQYQVYHRCVVST